jgi:hypothetical protein
MSDRLLPAMRHREVASGSTADFENKEKIWPDPAGWSWAESTTDDDRSGVCGRGGRGHRCRPRGCAQMIEDNSMHIRAKPWYPPLRQPRFSPRTSMIKRRVP